MGAVDAADVACAYAGAAGVGLGAVDVAAGVAVVFGAVVVAGFLSGGG